MAGRLDPQSDIQFCVTCGGGIRASRCSSSASAGATASTPNATLDYDFERFRPEDYYPDRHEGSPGETVGPGERECCRDKLFFSLIVRAIGGNTPPVLAENVGGRPILYTDEAADFGRCWPGAASWW